MSRTVLNGLDIDYVCSPTSLRLNAKEDLVNRRTTVQFTIGSKVVHEWSFRISLKNCGDEEQIHEAVGKLITQFMSHSRNYVQHRLDFLAMNVWTGLKEVRSKSGKLIWRR